MKKIIVALIILIIIIISCITKKPVQHHERFIRYNEVVTDSIDRSVDSIFNVNNLKHVPFDEWNKHVLVTHDKTYIYNYFNIQASTDSVYIISVTERKGGLAFIKVRVEAKK